MRVIPVTVLGKEYDLCFSTRVMMRVEQEHIDTDTASGSVFLLSALMEAGDRYAKLNGQPGKGFLTVDEIADNLSPDELGKLALSMTLATTGERNVETVDNEKNAEKTPPDA